MIASAFLRWQSTSKVLKVPAGTVVFCFCPMMQFQVKFCFCPLMFVVLALNRVCFPCRFQVAMRSVEGMGGRIAWLSLMLPSSEGGVRSSGYFVMRGVVCFCLLALPYGRAAQRQTRFIYCVCFGWR